MSIETGRETNEQLVQKIKAGEDVTENMTSKKRIATKNMA